MKHIPDEKEKHHFYNSNCRVKNGPHQMTAHHYPPKHPDITPRPRVIKKERRLHEAYHLLFGNAANFEMACEILKRDWWPD